MKRHLLYIIIVLALLIVPAERSDVGRLLPVELLQVDIRGGRVEIQTDTGNAGVGENIDEAYEDLRKKASSQIFLDTADYLILIGEESIGIEELTQYLKGDIRVCTADGNVDLKDAAMYLSEHKPAGTLKEARKSGYMEHLTQTGNGFELK